VRQVAGRQKEWQHAPVHRGYSVCALAVGACLGHRATPAEHPPCGFCCTPQRHGLRGAVAAINMQSPLLSSTVDESAEVAEPAKAEVSPGLPSAAQATSDWYYLEAGAMRGPVAAPQIAAWVSAGFGSTQVSQVRSLQSFRPACEYPQFSSATQAIPPPQLIQVAGDTNSCRMIDWSARTPAAPTQNGPVTRFSEAHGTCFPTLRYECQSRCINMYIEFVCSAGFVNCLA
jgi:hypothetical protein